MNAHPLPERRLISIPHAARHLGISERTLRSLVAAGEIAVIRVSARRLAIDPADLDAYIARRKVARSS